MFANITYLRKEQQLKKRTSYYSTYLYVANRFGYEGNVSFSFYDGALSGLYLTDKDYRNTAPDDLVARAINWLQNGDIPMDIVLFGTQFQLAVWSEITKIRLGERKTYQDIARAIGNKKACRAVGSAVGKNPISLIIPCHRVVNKAGKKSSYAWGSDVKKRILEFEDRLKC